MQVFTASLWLHVRNRLWGTGRPLRRLPPWSRQMRVDRTRVTEVEVERNGQILNILWKNLLMDQKWVKGKEGKSSTIPKLLV